METFFGILLALLICGGIFAAGWITHGGIWSWLFFPIIECSAWQFCLEYRIPKPSTRLVVAASLTLLYSGLQVALHGSARHTADWVFLGMTAILLADRFRLSKRKA